METAAAPAQGCASKSPDTRPETLRDVDARSGSVTITLSRKRPNVPDLLRTHKRSVRNWSMKAGLETGGELGDRGSRFTCWANHGDPWAEL
jgi:hypothetical protein